MPTCHPLSPGRVLVLTSGRGSVNPTTRVLLEGLGQLGNAVTSLGIEPVTFGLVDNTSANYTTETNKGMTTINHPDLKG